ncbi:MAG: hypothetical protein COB56_08050 [Robiginitomaculum sp.]|nr:MAG: hypothetical protein COB56_08050 [Robiginitomaculum sp.]
MKIMTKFAAISTMMGTMALAQPAFAQLEAYQDYNINEATSIVTTVKVDSNMIDYYLEGLRSTWAPSNDLAIGLGQMEGYSIFVSALPNSGAFNVVLVTNFKSTADLAPSKARNDAFMEKWGKEQQKLSRKTSKGYPDIRTITGSYMMNEVTFVKEEE